ncbi:hypothetical protein Tco_0200918 [Tanacetum coccineum]
MEINNSEVKWDPNNIEFENWLASKLRNHKMMDRYTKNALWEYWRSGDDEEVITHNELSNPRDNNLIEENEIAQIFRIDTDIFCFESPLCEAFKEFNYLSQIDIDVLTKYIHGFKTYEEYKDDWIYEWKKVYHGSMKTHGQIMDYGVNLLIISIMNAIHFASKMGLMCGLLVIRKKMGIATLETYLDSFVKAIQFSMKIMNVFQIIADHCEIQKKDEEWFDEHELIGEDDNDIGDIEDYLIQKDPPYYVNEEEEISKKKRCKL